MARRRRGTKIDGWIVLDKPAGLTSTQALGKVRRLLDAQKAGHGGTLDPLATGILPIGLGEATKAMPHIVDATKEYAFTVKWGEARDTDDLEGAVVAVDQDFSAIDGADIEDILADHIGEIDQIPPAYSAIKVDGRRAYDLARAGEMPDLAPRRVHIHDLRLLWDCAPERTAHFRLVCGKGTYVRSLARDLARDLGTYGHVIDLRRTRVGPFDQSTAISLEKLETLSHKEAAAEQVLPVMTALADIPALAVTEEEARRLKSGQSLRLPTAEAGPVRVTHAGTLIAIARAEHGVVRPVRVFNI